MMATLRLPGRKALVMTTVGIPRRQALLLLAALPAACSSPNPVLYVLAPVPGPVPAPVRGKAPHTIAVRAISLAQYLQRSQIVRSSEGYKLDVLYNEWWGEPLDALINRILVQELSQRLPGSLVFSDNGAISTAADATVEINLQRLDVDQAGAVLLLAQAAVTGDRTGTRSLSISVVPGDGTTAALVAAMSAAVGQMADVISGMLEEPQPTIRSTQMGDRHPARGSRPHRPPHGHPSTRTSTPGGT